MVTVMQIVDRMRDSFDCSFLLLFSFFRVHFNSTCTL